MASEEPTSSPVPTDRLIARNSIAAMVVRAEDENALDAQKEEYLKYQRAVFEAYKFQDVVSEVRDKKRHEAAFAEFMKNENEAKGSYPHRIQIVREETSAGSDDEHFWQTDSNSHSRNGNGNEGDGETEYGTCYSADATVFSASTGVRTQIGGTWHAAYTLNYSSGFAGGAPYSANYKGVREGREDETAVYGVGRTGKRPVKVPASMVEAMRADQLFEVKVHGLPAHLKRQLDETLKTFAQEMTDKTTESGFTMETSDVKRQTDKDNREANRDGYVDEHAGTGLRAVKNEGPYGARSMSDDGQIRPQSGTSSSFRPQSIIELETDDDYDYGSRTRPPVQEKQTSLITARPRRAGTCRVRRLDSENTDEEGWDGDDESEDRDAEGGIRRASVAARRIVEIGALAAATG